MADTSSVSRGGDDLRLNAQAAVPIGKLWQLPDGRAAAYTGQSAAASGDPGLRFSASGQYVVPKATGVVLIDGGRLWWDRSAGQATYLKVDDRDFLLGRVVGDAASGDTTCTVNLNVDPRHDLDLARDSFVTALVGTQALGGLGLYRRGGATKLLLSSTVEAQKTDALSREGFAAGGAVAVVEVGITVVSVGTGGAQDFNIGIASGTNATDADSIAQHLFCHVDGNSTAIKFQSKDGTHTVAATDSTVTLTAGTRFEVWFDLRLNTSVKVYVNGVRVLSGTTFDVSAAAATWLLLAHLEKTSAADTFEVDVDWLRARYTEQRG